MRTYDKLQKSNEYKRKWLQARRAEWFAGRSCVTCGSVKNLQVDHIDPKTKDPYFRSHHITNIWGFSYERRSKELAKCQALCKRCHELKTGKENRTNTHGTAGMYQHQKCRCFLCCEWKRLSNEKYRSSDWKVN